MIIAGPVQNKLGFCDGTEEGTLVNSCSLGTELGREEGKSVGPWVGVADRPEDGEALVAVLVVGLFEGAELG